MSTTQIILTVISIACFIPALVLHEFAHGFAANKLGDPTAKNLGRLSINPLKHIDPFGTVVLPLILALSGMPVFGYAKPVPYNPRNFKNIKRGEVITGLAGPLANLIQALIGALIGFICTLVVNGSNAHIISWIYTVAYYYSITNLYLMFFNLIPIPPLDGSSIISIFLSEKGMQKYYSIQQYAMPALMIILVVLPMVIHVNPIGLYLNFTAGNVASWLFIF